MADIKAPWTPEQVQRLKDWQDGTLTYTVQVGDTFIEAPHHPFTCCSHEGCKRSEHDEGILIPSIDGWVCPCGKYKQDWAHDFMCNEMNEDEK